MSSGTAGLAPGFKEKVDALIAASHGTVFAESGYRTYAEQAALRKANGCPDVAKSPATSCTVRPTAPAGSSKHEEGLAVDFGGDTALAARLASQFGLHRTVGDDPNHYEAVDTTIPGVPQTGGGATQPAVDAVAGVGSGPVDGLLEGIKTVLITGAFLATGATLVAAGAYRATTGRSLAGAVATKGAQGAKIAALAAGA